MFLLLTEIREQQLQATTLPNPSNSFLRIDQHFAIGRERIETTTLFRTK